MVALEGGSHQTTGMATTLVKRGPLRRALPALLPSDRWLGDAARCDEMSTCLPWMTGPDAVACGCRSAVTDRASRPCARPAVTHRACTSMTRGRCAAPPRSRRRHRAVGPGRGGIPRTRGPVQQAELASATRAGRAHARPSAGPASTRQPRAHARFNARPTPPMVSVMAMSSRPPSGSPSTHAAESTPTMGVRSVPTAAVAGARRRRAANHAR